MRVLLALFLLLFSSQMVIAETSDYRVVNVWYFYTGEKFLNIPRNNPNMIDLDMIYVAGLSDALNITALSNPQYAWVTGCTMRREMRQLTEIFKKWLKNNPERWHEPAPLLFIEAIKESCK